MTSWLRTLFGREKVGSSLKVNGYTWNPVEPARVREFMAAVNKARHSQ